MNLFERWSKSLQELRATGRYRQLGPLCGIDFSSNDYLGRCGRRSSGDGPAQNGSTPTARSGMASRLLRGNHAVWETVEAELACWHGAEAALMFTSGYVANEGLLATILEPGDLLISDEFNHASIVDGGRLGRAEKFIFRHNDPEHLEAGLRQASVAGQRFVVTESLFGMDGDRAPLQEMANLCQRYAAHLIVDEAHATGCFGAQGGGCVDETGLRDRVLATVHTGGKALGVAGAYVCGSARLRELLINRCRHFIYTTALPPALGEWWLDAIADVCRDDDGRRRLHDRASHFRRELARHGVAAGGNHYIVPIIFGSDTRALEAAEMLKAKGYDIRAIRPPSVPPGTARLRFSIHADHDPDLLSAVAEAVGHAARSTSVNNP